MTLLGLNSTRNKIVSDANMALHALCLKAAVNLGNGKPTVDLTLADGTIASIGVTINSVLIGGSPAVSFDGYLNILDALAKHPAITGVREPVAPVAAVPIAPAAPVEHESDAPAQ